MNTLLTVLLKHALNHPEEFTTQTLEKAAADASCSPRCEFLRLPRLGQRCPMMGLTRGFLNSVVLSCKANDFKPPVRSFTSDLIRYIRQHVELTYQKADLTIVERKATGGDPGFAPASWLRGIVG